MTAHGAIAGFVGLGVLAACGLVGLFALRGADAPARWGVAAGAAFGAANLAATVMLVRRALRPEATGGVRWLVGKALGAFAVVLGLALLFWKVDAVDHVTFSLSAIVAYFVALGVEVWLVQRTLGRRRAAR